MLSKPKLFTLISVIVIAVLAIPVILPHLRDPSMIYHILLHTICVIISVFLSTTAFLAYQRTRTTRSLLMALGFLLLTAAEILYLYHSIETTQELMIPVVHAELSHIILLIMLALFGAGVVKINR